MGLYEGNGETSGYNCAQVNALRDVINSTAQNAANSIVEKLHSGIVKPMSSIWYAPEAVEFFQSFATVVQSTGQSITEAFDAFRDFVQQAGAHWAENTKGEVPNLPAIDLVELNLNVSEIQPNNAGNVTINEGEATSLASNLGQVEEEIEAELKSLAENLSADSAFIGHSQAASLKDCFVKVSGAVESIFKFLTEGDESLQTAINKTVEKYQSVSEEVSNSASNVSIEK